jgi:hypothetical protein
LLVYSLPHTEFFSDSINFSGSVISSGWVLMLIICNKVSKFDCCARCFVSSGPTLVSWLWRLEITFVLVMSRRVIHFIFTLYLDAKKSPDKNQGSSLAYAWLSD